MNQKTTQTKSLLDAGDRIDSYDEDSLICPNCHANWPKHRLSADGVAFRVNFCRCCAAELWTQLPCGHDTPISELPYNYCGECGKPTELAAALVQA